MKQMNKLAAAVAMALGMGVMAPSANAIVYDDNGIGDALIFPVYNGYVDNYYTISNNSGEWIQGHLRFRGAAWSAEVRDFDVILSPGDVFVFRLTDLVADTALIPWEIDQSLDPKNFAYTGMTMSCGSVADCMEPDDRLIKPACPPVANAPATTEECIHQATVGYVEFFGEAVLDGMTGSIMASLLNPNLSGAWKPYQDDLYAGIGTNAWRWSDAPSFDACPGDADGNGRCDRGLSDVGNVLSGTAFIVIPGRSQGLAYNAEAFVNFRTASGWGTHRIDNYRVDYPNSGGHMLGNGSAQATADSAVILHDESGADGNGPTPFGDYVYHYNKNEPSPDDRQDEVLVSFNNTWGPTLADGDDYSAILSQRNQRDTGADVILGGDPELDDWEASFGGVKGYFPVISFSRGNSIAEVEEAIREKGQNFTTYYFDGSGFGGGALSTWFFTHFPTKFYYGADPTNVGVANTLEEYIRLSVYNLLQMGKPVALEIWDINEVPGGQSRTGCISPDPCAIQTDSVMGYELNFYGIPWFKSVFNTGVASSFTSGRVVVRATGPANNPRITTGGNPNMAWPMDSFAFEMGGSEVLGQWRSMNQGMDMHSHVLALP